MTQWKVFRYPLTIKMHHLDTFGHVNNAVYLQILEEARWAILEEGSFSYKDILKSKLGPVILEVNLKFIKELLAGERIVIASQVKDYSGKICNLQQEIKNEAGESCAVADFKIALFDLEKRKLILPTEQWLSTIGQS